MHARALTTSLGTYNPITKIRMAERTFDDAAGARSNVAQVDLACLGPAIAHDFRSLFTVVLGNARLLAEDISETSALYPLVRDIVDAGERAVGLTRELDALGAPRTPRCIDLDLRAGVRSCAGILKAVAGGALLTLPSATAPVRVNFDPIHLSQILINLVSNARDAADGGGAIEIGVNVIKSEACIAVTDGGRGISVAVLPRIFEPYVTTNDAGRGLGLAMVAALARQAGGRCTAENVPGGGARIRVFLPLLRDGDGVDKSLEVGE